MTSLPRPEIAGPPEPSAAPQADAGGWSRLDPRMLVVHPLREVLRLLPVLAGILLAGSTAGGGNFWGLTGTGIAIGLGLLRWFTTTYRVADNRVQLRRGVFQRRVLSVPLDRIRTVDISASALHRVLGLVRLTLGTGLSDRKSDRDLVLDGLSAVEGERLRAELLHRRAPAGVAAAEEAAGAAGVAAPPAEDVIAAAPPAWARYGPFTLSGFLTVFVILGFGWRIVSEARLDPRDLAPVMAGSAAAASVPGWVGVVAAVVLLLVVVAVASTVGYVLAFWGFRLARTGDALQVTRGLITTRNTTIELRRLRGVELSEPLLLRMVRGARCIAIATGLRVGRGSERGGSLLLPPAPLSEARRVAGAVLGEADPVTTPLRRHGRAAHRRRYTRLLMVWVVVAAALVAATRLLPVPGWTWELALALVPIGALLAYDRYRSLGHALVGRTLVARNGSLVRRRSMLETDGIIGWNLNRSFFQRRAGVATLVATTAAGRQGYAVQDVPVDEAVRLADRAVPELLTPFLEPG